MRVRILSVLVLAGVAACGAPATPPPASAPPPAATMSRSGAARAEALEGATATYRKVDTHREQGTGRTDLSGYFDHGRLAYLDENISAPGAPARHNRYFFENGQLFYFKGEMQAGKIGGGPTALGASVPVRAEFAGARTLTAVSIEHYGETRLDAPAVEAIRRQGAELASAITSEEQASRSR